MTDTLTLTLTTEGLEYEIDNIQRVSDDQRKEAVAVAPPGKGPRDNLLLGVAGMQADIEIVFMMHDNGTDRSKGTHSSTVVTIAEQREYLKYDMHDQSFDAAWELDDDQGGQFDDEEVFLESVQTAAFDRTSPKWRETTLMLRVGESL